MKKIIAMSLLMFSVVMSVNAKNTVASKKEEQIAQPIAGFRLFDLSGKAPQLIEGNKFSRAKPHQLCIFVENVEVKEQNLLAEYFVAPAPIRMQAENAETRTTGDGTGNLIIFNLPKANIASGAITQCWQFSKNDPVGTYQLELQFNDIVFKGLAFQILK